MGGAGLAGVTLPCLGPLRGDGHGLASYWNSACIGRCFVRICSTRVVADVREGGLLGDFIDV